MKNYESKLDNTGQFFRSFLEERFSHIPHTEELILSILSFQKDLIWNIDEQVWKIYRKAKRHGKLDTEKFAHRFSSSEK